MEKKAKQFDKLVCEWKGKVDSLSMDLDIAQKECRNASSELFRVKNAYEEGILQLDEVRKENKSLSNEIKDIMDQISEGGRSIHEIDKIRKRLEAEKMELQAALEEAEGYRNGDPCESRVQRRRIPRVRGSERGSRGGQGGYVHVVEASLRLQMWRGHRNARAWRLGPGKWSIRRGTIVAPEQEFSAPDQLSR
jgi:uncharacterized protein (UPF0335 family)